MENESADQSEIRKVYIHRETKCENIRGDGDGSL